jgi:hypothetical protein
MANPGKLSISSIKEGELGTDFKYQSFLDKQALWMAK